MSDVFEVIDAAPEGSITWSVSSEPCMYTYVLAGPGIPRPSKAMLYHMAASGFFSGIEVRKDYGFLIRWGRKEMQEFVAVMNLRGHQALERELAGESKA